MMCSTPPPIKIPTFAPAAVTGGNVRSGRVCAPAPASPAAVSSTSVTPVRFDIEAPQIVSASVAPSLLSRTPKRKWLASVLVDVQYRVHLPLILLHRDFICDVAPANFRDCALALLRR